MVLAVLLLSAGLSLLLSLIRVCWVGLRSGQRAEHPCLLVPGKRLEQGRPDADYRARLQAAADQDVSRIVILGGVTDASGISEAAAGLAWLRQQASALDDRVMLEEASTTTFENFRNARALLGRDSACSILSNRYHLARCLAQARALGLRVSAVAAEPWPGMPLLPALRETWYLHLFSIGSGWARLRRHSELLAFLD